MNQENDWAVGLVHELCPICCAKMNEMVIIPERLTAKTKENIEQSHMKPIGFSAEPCEECKKNLDKGYIALIGIDPEKSDTSSLEGIYRTGSLFWLKERVFDEVLGRENVINSQFAFAEQAVMEHIRSQVEQ